MRSPPSTPRGAKPPSARAGTPPRPRHGQPPRHGHPPRAGQAAAPVGVGRAASGPGRPREASPPRRERGEPGAATWLYGYHAVAAALANPNRLLRRLMLTEEAEAGLLGRLPAPWPVAAERTERARLDQLLGRDVVHQGAALLADRLPSPSLAEALSRPGPVLVLDQVSDPRNVGALLRSAAGFGVAALVLQDRHAPEETGALAKAASGALETVPLLRAVNLARTLAALKASGLWVVGLEAGGGVLRGEALAGRRVALVLGAEGSGLRRLTRETCDELLGLQLQGGVESLNVSVAGAIALYELGRAV